jgi:DNA invertase Pin-like site-specific DNA recombinase
MPSYQIHNLHNDEIYNFQHKNYIYEIVKNKNNLCIGYARKSTKNQTSISEQIDKIKIKAKSDGFKYVLVFHYEGSGWNINNIKKLQGFNSMIKFIKDFSNLNIHIYIYDVSRFMRNVLVATKFLNDVFDKYNCTIHSIIDNKVWDKNDRNRIDFIQELVQAEKFSILLSDKMKQNIIKRKSDGEHIGKAKFGYEKFKFNKISKIRRNKYEQSILGYIKKEISDKTFKNYKVRRLHYNKICNRLNDNNFLKRGESWDINKLKYVIKNNLNYVITSDLNIHQEDTETDNWLQCDKCNKWRKLPLDKYYSLKDNMLFFCGETHILNCNIPEEVYHENTNENYVNDGITMLQILNLKIE